MFIQPISNALTLISGITLKFDYQCGFIRINVKARIQKFHFQKIKKYFLNKREHHLATVNKSFSKPCVYIYAHTMCGVHSTNDDADNINAWLKQKNNTLVSRKE